MLECPAPLSAGGVECLELGVNLVGVCAVGEPRDVCLARMQHGTPETRPYAKDDRTFQRWLIFIMVVQLVLGAAQRHLAALLIVHICLAAVVVLLAVMVGGRAWGLYRNSRPVEYLGKLLITFSCVQVFLGITALAVTQGRAIVGSPTTLEVTITTMHQATGAVLLALSLALHLWTRRMFRPDVVQ